MMNKGWALFNLKLKLQLTYLHYLSCPSFSTFVELTLFKNQFVFLIAFPCKALLIKEIPFELWST